AGVPARPLIEVDVPIAEEPRRLVTADLEPGTLRHLVGALLETQVVDVESRRLVARVKVEARHLAADLVEVDRAGMSAERRSQRVVGQMRRVRLLEAVHVAALQAIDRRRRSRHAARGPPSIEAVLAALQAPVALDAARDRVAREERQFR